MAYCMETSVHWEEQGFFLTMHHKDMHMHTHSVYREILLLTQIYEFRDLGMGGILHLSGIIERRP